MNSNLSGHIHYGSYEETPTLTGVVDKVNHPEHYTKGGIESIDYMKSNMTTVGFCGFLEGSVKKYLHRFRYKGKPIEDLKKARWYLDRLIEEMEGNP